METKEKDLAALRFIEEVTSHCDEVQRKVLGEILSQNADTEYLKRHGVKAGIDDPETYKNKVPVVTYEHIQPDIQRIANGDFSPILCAQPITEFLTSSGTSAGERKLMPITAEDMNRRLVFSNLHMPLMNQYIPGLDKGKGLFFQFIKAETKTPGGLVAHPVLTSIYKSESFKNRPYDPNHVYTSPIEAILCLDSFQSMYTQMLCGLYDRHTVLRMGAVFASALLRAIHFLQVHYRDLCHDITTGTLNPQITDSGLQAQMAKIMRPDPELAEFINHACRGDNWEGIIKKIWPNTLYLDAIVTGAMAQYVPTLDYFSGGLPKVCSFYASSECSFGLNLNPMCHPSEVSYVVFPHMAFFEFIPLDDASSVPQLVNLADVEVGKEYELVVTTYSGLYRYCVGDILQVTGFYNSAPQVKFIRRKDVLLSIDSDKTNESELQKAIDNAFALLQPLNTSIVDYTSYADTNTIPGHYVIYWELLAKDPTNEPGNDVLGQCCLAMEDYAISRGASINQYKTPRCVSYLPMVELLDSRVVSAHFSPSLPHWSP